MNLKLWNLGTLDVERALEEPRQDEAIDKLERRLAGGVMAAAERGDLVRNVQLAKRRDEILGQIPETSDRNARTRAASSDRAGVRDTSAG